MIKTYEEVIHTAWITAYQGLQKQNWERAVGYTSCVWLDRQNRRCAIGHLIDPTIMENLKSRSPNGMVYGIAASALHSRFLVKELQEWYDLAEPKEREFFKGFARSLQTAHDDSPNPVRMEKRFKCIGENNGWALPTVGS